MHDLIDAHRHSANHRAELLGSDSCGCFYCLTIFTPQAISDWVDGPAEGPDGQAHLAGTTAACPLCGVDAVIGSASGYPLTPQFLQQMQAHWFHRGPVA